MMRYGFILIILFSQQALAYIHFEPGIGYNRGHFGSSKSQGIGLTTKLGAEFSDFFIVADVGYHDLQLGSIPSSTAIDLGASFGGDFKSWRFWFTYLFSGSLAYDSGGTETKFTGDGIKLGLSGLIAKRTYLNLEVRFIDFEDQDGNPVTQFMDVALLSVSWKLL